MADGPVEGSGLETSSDDGDKASQGSKQSEELSFAWSEETYRLSDVTGVDQLPRVVRLEEDNPNDVSPGIRPYLRQPVFLDHTVRKNDCSARTVYRDKSNGKYFEVGQTLIIPDNYEGWFELVPETFGRAPYYSNIGQVAKVFPKRFFTRSALNAVDVSKDSKGVESYREKKIPPGAILKTVNVFSARWKTQTKSGLFKKKDKEYVTQDIQYLRCRTPDRKEILVPFQESGKFNVIYERDRKEENLNAIYRLKDLVSDLVLPVMVRLLYGKAPVVPCIFTGLLVLKSFEKRETIIGSTVVNKRNVLFELPVNTPCSLLLSANEEQFDALHTFKDSKRLCRKYAQSFAGMIKLSTDLDTYQEMIEHKPKIQRKSLVENLDTLDLIKDMKIGESQEEKLLEPDSTSQAESESADNGKVLELVKECDKKGETAC